MQADQHWKQVPGEQHHARVYRLGLNWYEANITKYAERSRLKGSFLDDILKVLDYGTLYLENAGKQLVPELPSPTQCAKLVDLAERLQALAHRSQAFEKIQLERALGSAANRYPGLPESGILPVAGESAKVN